MGDATIDLTPKELQSLWQDALCRWGTAIDLSAPVPITEGDAIAYISLQTRQTHVNFALLQARGLAPFVGIVFAHEVGHHARFPQTLVRNAKLTLRLRALLRSLETERPGLPRIGEGFAPHKLDYLANLLLDVLINDELRSEHNLDFPSVYRALGRAHQGPASAAFAFTMALYEALWQLAEQTIATQAQVVSLQAVSDRWKDEAQALAEALRASTGNMYIGLDLYVEAVWPYVVRDCRLGLQMQPPSMLEAPFDSDLDDLDPHDVTEVVRSTGEEREADEARFKRLHPTLVELPADEPAESAERSESSRGIDPAELARILAVGRELSGKATDPPNLVRAYYENWADRLLIDLPQEASSSPQVPTTLTEWEPGDDPKQIDWVASLGRAGIAIPGVTLFERDYELEPEGTACREPAWMEIYIDSSASMPNPSVNFNPLVLAGLLLSRAAVEAGSRVRIVQYAGPGDVISMPDFSADRHEVFRALLQYFGSGTQYPFSVLNQSMDRFQSMGAVHRVVLTDTDFFFNVNHPEEGSCPLGVLTHAAMAPNQFTVILHDFECVSPRMNRLEPAGLIETGVRLIGVKEWNQLHHVAIALGRAVFGKGG
jgi:hypothetical protein